MGDRFYMQQKKDMGTRWKTDGSGKAKRRLKAEVLAEVYDLLGKEVAGLDKCTIVTLEELILALQSALADNETKSVLDFMARAVTGE